MFDLESLDGSNGFTIIGPDEFDARSGFDVSSAGDINGDGFDDMMVSAFWATAGAYPSYARRGGVTYVVFGGSAGFPETLEVQSLDGSNGFALHGIDEYDESGWSIASAGDVNGDGFDDIIIGARNADRAIGEYDSGEAYVIFGRAGGFSSTMDLSSLDGANGFVLKGIHGGDAAGYSVSSAGDFNGDGFDDLLISAPAAEPGNLDFAGQSYVVFGKPGGFTKNFNLSALDGANGFRMDGPDRSGSGHSVSSAGDVNGDGLADVVIGAPRAYLAGASFVVFGSAGALDAAFNLTDLDGANGFVILSDLDRDYSNGRSVAGAGDINGDGFADIIIGAPSAFHPSSYDRIGRAFVIFGKSGGFEPTVNLSQLDGANGFKIEGDDVDDLTGWSVAGAGDFNGDGFDDILFSARAAEFGGYDNGACWVVFGKSTGFDASLSVKDIDGANGFRIEGIAEFDNIGQSVSAAGDVNGDGFSDIMIGSPYVDDDRHGHTYVVFGFATSGRRIEGTGGADSLAGSDFDGDTVLGFGGADTLAGEGGADRLEGGEGSDWADYQNAPAKVRADLKDPSGNSGDAEGDVYVSIENLRGSAFNDALLGDDLANRIEGLGKSDLISGRGGKDTLAGGAGRDTLKGGEKNDRFELTSLDADDADRILDFAPGGDKIALDGDVFGLTRVKPSQFVVGTAAGDANDRLIYNDATGKLFFDSDGTGAQAKVLIATFTGAPALSAADFVVI